MASLLNVLLGFGIGLNALIGSALFIVGLVVGIIVMRRWYKKPVPPEYESLETAIRHIDAELGRTNSAVSRVWKKAKFREHERAVPGQVSSPPPTDKDWKERLKNLFSRLLKEDIDKEQIEELHPLTIRLINIKKVIESFGRDLNYYVDRLSDEQVSNTGGEDQTAGKEREAPAIVDSHQPADAGYSVLFENDQAQSQTSNYDRTIEVSEYSDYSEQQYSNVKKPTPSSATAAKIKGGTLELYNRAVTDLVVREQFREQFQPIRIGTTNAVERTGNPTIVAEFRETTDGNFFAFPIHGKKGYAVVPRLGLTIEAVSYSAGAVGEVFSKTQGHDPTLFYSRYSVLKPAIFKCENGRWELQEPGKLDLGPGD